MSIRESATKRARKTLLSYAGSRDYLLTEGHQTVITDLVADLLHLADKTGADMEEVWRMAHSHHSEEKVDGFAY